MNDKTEKSPLILATATLPEASDHGSMATPGSDAGVNNATATATAKAIVKDAQSQSNTSYSTKSYQNPPKVSNNENAFSSDHNSSDANNSRYWGRFQYPEVTVQSGPVEGGSALALPTGEATALASDWDDREIRHAFIRKVYLILSAQMFVTFAICAFMSLHIPTRSFILQHFRPLYWTSFILMLLSIVPLNLFKRDYPMNMIVLSIFTVCTSNMVGMVTAGITAQGGSGIVLEAVFLTASVFVFLSLFTLQTKWNFSVMGAGLGMSLWILLLWGFLSMFFGHELGKLYSLFGALLFSGYIIFDTYMLAEKHDPRDYVVAAVELYLDIINLFLYILELLSDNR